MSNAQNTKATVESAIESAEAKLQEASETLSQNAEALVSEANRAVNHTVSDVETFVRQKPMQAIGIAFAAGFVATLLLRRSR